MNAIREVGVTMETLYGTILLHSLDYLKGEKNILADCFSRLPRMEEILVGKKELEMIENQKGTMVDDFKSLKVLSKNDEDEAKSMRNLEN